MRYFPLFADLAGRPVLVIGGDETAARKVRLLLKADARVQLVAADLTAELAELAGGGRAEYLRDRFDPTDLKGAALVVVAETAGPEAERVALAAREAGVPVNVVDRPDLSTVIMPGIVDRDPVIVAIGSAGTAPVLVRRLRERIETLLPTGLGRLARFADRFREAVAAGRPDGRSRRLFWERVFDGAIAERVLAGDEAGANDAMLRTLNRQADAPEAGSVALVGVGPGDPDLLTLRALRAMQDADVVVHDALIGPEILDYVRRDADRIDVGKRKGAHACSQDRINALLIAEARAGRRVLRLKGGDPFIFGRGGEELDALREAGIAVEVVPGITAALGAAAVGEIPLTRRGVASAVTLVTGHGADGETDLDPALLAGDHTLAIYMGLSVAGRLADRLIAAGRPASTPVAVIERATWPDQRTLTGRLDDLAGLIARESVAGPALLVVGEVTRNAKTTGLPDADRRIAV